MDPLLHDTKLEYYENGILKNLIDANGHATNWSIDLQSRVTSKTDQDGRRITNTFENATSRLRIVTDPLQQQKIYGYAVDNRIASITYLNALNPTPAVTFSYDAFFPRVASMTDGNGTRQYFYQPVGSWGALKLLREAGPYQNDAISYQYDALGRVIEREVDNSAETFGYDSLGRLTFHRSPLDSFDMHYLGETNQMANRRIRGGSDIQWNYDTNTNDRRLLSISNYSGTRSFSYDRTAENIITRVQESGPSGIAAWTFSYDNKYRLLNAASSGNQYSYSYDPADNISTFNDALGTRAATYDPANQIVSAGGKTYIYDANGNVTSDGEQGYRWDADNRLVRILPKAGGSISLSYDGLGRRSTVLALEAGAASETRYLWCGQSICQARTATDSVARRYYPEGEVIVSPATSLYYAQDHLGSVRDVISSGANQSVSSFDYDPYGNLAKTRGRGLTDFRYAGLFYESNSGLYLSRTRAYDPAAARWLSRDLLGESGGLNLFGYAQANPLNRRDPSGLRSQDGLDACLVPRRPFDPQRDDPPIEPEYPLETLLAFIFGGELLAIGREAEVATELEEGAASYYGDVTVGNSVRNVATDVTQTQFEKNLTASGWNSTVSADGNVAIFEKDGAKYVVRNFSNSGPATADFTPAGSGDISLKIRLGQRGR